MKEARFIYYQSMETQSELATGSVAGDPRAIASAKYLTATATHNIEGRGDWVGDTAQATVNAGRVLLYGVLETGAVVAGTITGQRAVVEDAQGATDNFYASLQGIGNSLEKGGVSGYASAAYQTAFEVPDAAIRDLTGAPKVMKVVG